MYGPGGARLPLPGVTRRPRLWAALAEKAASVSDPSPHLPATAQ